ncbi:MAG: tRNA lysidine(34) synthetase TilS [Verrucomicrobiales bacterium]
MPARSIVEKLASLRTTLPQEATYLIGCSGGRDSVVLLDALLEADYGKLVVCHLNHRLRGTAAEEDANFIVELAQTYGLESEIGAVDVRRLAQKRKLSIETAGREARREFFAKVARKRKCQRVFLAHHADDQVETVLMNLFRGAAARGASGMRMISQSEGGLTLIRPLLDCWREEIAAYARKHALKWREDASNASLDPLRNRIRHELIPALSQMCQRDVRRTIWKSAAIAEVEDALLSGLTDQAWLDVAALDGLSVVALRAQPLAIRRRLVERWLRESAVPTVGFSEITGISDLIEPAAAVSKVNLPGGWRARRRSGLLFLDRQKPQPSS